MGDAGPDHDTHRTRPQRDRPWSKEKKNYQDSSFWLPLYGNLCCHLVAQPTCMTDDVITGFLNQQETAGGIRSWIRMYCVLKGGNLHCYYTPEEIEAKLEATMTIPINKETRIRAVEKDSKKRTNSFTIINLVSGEAVTKIFSTDSKEELQKWMEAFWQHFYNLSECRHLLVFITESVAAYL
ncbi:unnamed protein product [Ranitomeya imitator]|uniref:PH domain-containing protein n=1 Tax=Ranitomeya imitator TaxID=111125 RepID=A0ABN9LIC9_9NEOB|nr:unnamed protein product [Ranitomeya imitator]